MTTILTTLALVVLPYVAMRLGCKLGDVIGRRIYGVEK